MSNNKKGSLWSIWDLHVHTPASIYQKFGIDDEATWELYLKDLEGLPPSFSVLGINDYLFLDGYERLLNEQANGRLKNLVLFPVIEFRIDKFAGIDFGGLKRINLHVVFSNQIPIETIKSQFLNTLEQSYFLESGNKWTRAITRQSVEELGKEIKAKIPSAQLGKYGTDLVEGFNNLNVQEDRIYDALNKDCFKGKFLIAIGKTEWGDLKWTDASIATKKSVINRADIVFTAAKSPEEYKNAKSKLSEQSVNDLLLDCSDAHYLSNSTDKDRIGNCFNWIKADTTFDGLKQVLYEFDLRLCVSSTHPEERNKKFHLSRVVLSDSKNFPILNQVLDVNRDLVCIVGGRGSGKSALFESIAYCFDNHNKGGRYDSGRRYDSSKRYDSESFIDHYRSQEDCDFKIELFFTDLDGKPISTYVTSLKNRTELCSLPILYLGQNRIEEFANRTEEIHKLAFETVLKNTSQANELASIKGQIDQKHQALVQLNKDIEALRGNVLSLNEPVLIDERKKIQNELQLLSSEETKSIIASFNSTRLKRDKLSELEGLIGEIGNQNALAIGSLGLLIQRFENEIGLQIAQVNLIVQELQLGSDLLILDLSAFKETIAKLKSSVDKESITAEYNTALVQINEQLKGKTDLSVSYLESQKIRENEVSLKLEQVNRLKETLSDKEKERKSLIDDFGPLHQLYAELYTKAIKEFTNANTNILKSVHLTATVSKNIYNMVDKLFEAADKRKARDYDDFVSEYLFIDVERIADFDFIQWIDHFKSDKANFFVFNNLNEDAFDQIVFDNHYSLETEISYEVDPGDLKPLKRLSLGQKGTVLLKFYLSSGNNCPIFIDQPEDHLDNDFIYHDLVKTIRAAKIKRQIIMVTHDANLVVNGDADQVIVAKYADQKISHEFSGSLENPAIREAVSRILEGGKEAFQKREKKYQYEYA